MNPTISDPSIASRFSAAAPSYDQFARVQRQVADKLINAISHEPTFHRILEVGCGTGYLTRNLLERFPTSSIVAIDLSPRMVEEAQRSLPPVNRVGWRVSDLARFTSDPPFDLLASSSAMHWIEPHAGGFASARRLLKLGGELTCALMIHGTLYELRDARLRCAPHKVPDGVLPYPNELKNHLRQNGFQIDLFENCSYLALYPSARMMLTALHDMGLTGGSVSKSKVPLNRSELQRLQVDYDQSYRDESGDVRATYEVALIKAIRLE